MKNTAENIKNFLIGKTIKDVKTGKHVSGFCIESIETEDGYTVELNGFADGAVVWYIWHGDFDNYILDD